MQHINYPMFNIIRFVYKKVQHYLQSNTSNGLAGLLVCANATESPSASVYETVNTTVPTVAVCDTVTEVPAEKYCKNKTKKHHCLIRGYIQKLFSKNYPEGQLNTYALSYSSTYNDKV